jgi:hypothetical protein
MKIIKGYPPNYSAIIDALHPAGNFIFTYGDTIYSPTTEILDEEIIEHERVHERQQTENDKQFGPRKWWERYLIDGSFRWRQELEAYRAQWEYLERYEPDRNKRHKKLVEMARFLSSPSYGNLVGFAEAMEKIKKE